MKGMYRENIILKLRKLGSRRALSACRSQRKEEEEEEDEVFSS